MNLYEQFKYACSHWSESKREILRSFAKSLDSLHEKVDRLTRDVETLKENIQKEEE